MTGFSTAKQGTSAFQRSLNNSGLRLTQPTSGLSFCWVVVLIATEHHCYISEYRVDELRILGATRHALTRSLYHPVYVTISLRIGRQHIAAPCVIATREKGIAYDA